MLKYSMTAQFEQFIKDPTLLFNIRERGGNAIPITETTMVLSVEVAYL